MVTEELEVVKRPQSEDTRPRGRLSTLMARLIGPFRRGKEPDRQPAMGFYTDITVFRARRSGDGGQDRHR